MMTEETIIKTPEEAIETIKSNMPTSGYQMLRESLDMAIEALKEVQQYREIGASPEQLKELIFEGSATKRILRHYQEIGTVEECREAVEKQKPKKPLGGADINGNEYMICRECSTIVEDGEWRAMYCPDCGQAIQWGEDLEAMEDA